MKALTIWQPWASLIMAGAKPYEFRGWPAPRSLRGKRIAIHAGARPVRKAEIADLIISLRSEDAWTTGLMPEIAMPLLEGAYSSPGILPLSSILGTAILGEPRPAFEIVEEFGARLNDSDRHQHSNWAWPLTEIETLEPYQPAKGAQGFWEWRP
ncbi:ASCH domain-containing protein [Chelativorans sp. ZYF759]|uniref:ASCH domain-containing protein n=1 Tax=Chelativorans sp. ZYF759 TaxID=2692213 RepID=UPI00145E1D31|nr:ASCH domain-containing protein [Chelativorans sp. ZYF759]NMG39856.1 ASCH domain-containing protein [Chelativorans sp. ZYF759]